MTNPHAMNAPMLGMTMPLRALPNFCICCRIAFLLVYNTRKARESPIPQAKNRPVFFGRRRISPFIAHGRGFRLRHRTGDKTAGGVEIAVASESGISGSLANFSRMPGNCLSCPSPGPYAADKKPPPPVGEGGCIIARAGYIISSWANCTARFRIAMNGCVRRNSARVRSSRSSESRNSSVIRLAI